MIRHYGSRTLIAFGLFVLLLTACVGSSAQGIQLQSVVLAVGEEVFTTDGNLAIRFERVRQDSRCPTDVECPWAGDGEVVLRLQPVGASAVEQSLHTNASVGPGDVVIDGYEVFLEVLSPQPLSGSPIPPGDYEVVLRIEF